MKTPETSNTAADRPREDREREMGLFGYYRDGDELDRQTVLARFAICYRLASWQEESRISLGLPISAVDRMTNEDLLAKVAMESEYWPIADCAVEKLTDQRLLAKVAAAATIDSAGLVPGPQHVWNTAIKKVTDQELLMIIATTGQTSAARAAAAERLTDQASMARVALEDKDWYVRCSALRNLRDQTVLARVALEDDYNSVRRSAVMHLTSQAVLTKVASHDCDKSISKAAIERLAERGYQVSLAKTVVDTYREPLKSSLTQEAVDHLNVIGRLWLLFRYGPLSLCLRPAIIDTWSPYVDHPGKVIRSLWGHK